jgi:hypothetical protein
MRKFIAGIVVLAGVCLSPMAAQAGSFSNLVKAGCLVESSATNLHITSNTNSVSKTDLSFIDNLVLPNGGGTKVVTGTQSGTTTTNTLASGTSNSYSHFAGVADGVDISY